MRTQKYGMNNNEEVSINFQFEAREIERAKLKKYRGIF